MLFMHNKIIYMKKFNMSDCLFQTKKNTLVRAKGTVKRVFAEV